MAAAVARTASRWRRRGAPWVTPESEPDRPYPAPARPPPHARTRSGSSQSTHVIRGPCRPGVLPAGEPPGAGHGLLEGLVLGELAVEERQHLLVAEGAVRGAALAQAVRGQPRTSSTRPASHICRPERRSGRRGPAGGCRPRPGRRRRRSTPLGRVALNGRPVRCTTSSARTTRRPLLGWIWPRSPGPSRAGGRASPGALLGRAASSPAHHRVGARELEAVEHGAGVERRAADQDRRHATRRQSSTTARAQPGTPRRVAGSRHVEQVEQVVRDAAPVGGGKLRGADVHAAVDLHRVGVDDLAAERSPGRARARSCRPP